MALRVGVLGTGHFGRFHALKLAARGVLSGVHDADAARAATVAAECGTQARDAAGLIAASDAVIVTVPTAFHHAFALQAIAAGKHLFVEKPLAASVAQAEAILRGARDRGLVLQVGHIERYSAAIRTLRASGAGEGALAFEATRVAPFRPRSLDVSVVLDLMIHDLDLVLTLADAPLEEVRAVGRRVMSDHPDFAVAQLRFGNGAAATVTASRVSVALDRRLRVLGPQGETRVDFLARSLERLRPLRGAGDGAEPVASMPGWGIDRSTWTEHDSLEAEQAAFLASIEQGTPVEASGETGLRALDAALRVERAIAGG
ncbi:Gfo/Idh/MocA family protein [Paracraurococcus ruber]|uniref:Oxidoreductase n=1 Tax=Paracraurococcus ruber TaxID=77675 RepID=A0ABS1D119_9PROT|nr:Gfo/Idh/MocA family oxidoreductase [Paracraurococcus ruber]MBK1660186.1 oxidoreductase [Paracraurococcus ruber]TDG28341.1 Gfo/Idh/MocA family oxidoreductase [Paracraurococcus ruber]